MLVACGATLLLTSCLSTALDRVRVRLAQANTKAALSETLEMPPTICVTSRAEYEICSWSGISSGDVWYALSQLVNTRDPVNMVCEVPADGGPRDRGSCDIHPRRAQGDPDPSEAGREAAAQQLSAATGMREVIALVGDAPDHCAREEYAMQSCSWRATKEHQGWPVLASLGATEGPVDLACRFSLETGAVASEGCAVRVP